MTGPVNLTPSQHAGSQSAHDNHYCFNIYIFRKSHKDSLHVVLLENLKKGVKHEWRGTVEDRVGKFSMDIFRKQAICFMFPRALYSVMQSDRNSSKTDTIHKPAFDEPHI